MNTVSIVFISIIAFVALVFGGNYLAYQNDAFFMPKRESLRRDVMLNSRAYNEGMNIRLSSLHLQYTQAKTDDERDAIKGLVRVEVGAVDRSLLPLDIQAFLRQIGV